MPTPTILIEQVGRPPGSAGTSRDDLLVGSLCTLTDPANGGGTYAWVMRTRPTLSSATLSGASTDTATFVPDVPGTYLFSLTFDGTPSGTTDVIGQFLSSQGGAGVKETNGSRTPAAGEVVQFGLEGWHPAREEAIKAADRLRSALDTDHGSVFYADADGNLQPLVPSTSGLVLATQGPAAIPAWVAADTVGGNKLGAAYNESGAGAGRAIVVDAGAVTLTGNAADNNNVLEVTKNPAGAQSGAGLLVTLGATTTGPAVSIMNTGSGPDVLWGANKIVGGSLYLAEKASALGDVAGLGQFFIKNDAPNTAWFRNDDGIEFLLGAGGGATLAVTDIDDPSTELNAIAGGINGETRLCYEVAAGADAWTLYAWDSADSGSESVPYRVDGSSGMWAAVAGKYRSQSLYTEGHVYLGINQQLVLDDDADTYLRASADDTVELITGTTVAVSWTSAQHQINAGSLYLTERATAAGDTAGLGQFFVKNDAPCTAWFRDDTGVETQLGSMARIAGSTYSTVQDMNNVFHSAGWVTGGTITDDGDGTITVAAGNGLIRSTNSAVAPVLFTDWAAESGANVALTSNTMHWIYVDYNFGSPQVIAATSYAAPLRTSILLGTVFHNGGTTLHITDANRHQVGDHAAAMVRRIKETTPFARASGGVTGETGTRNFTVTAGNWWQGLTEFTTAAVDTSAADTFIAVYDDGASGWTKVTGQTQIDNLQYDDGSGSLATLSNNQYGVHWIYIESDDDLYSVYGRDSYTLEGAQNAPIPPTLPQWFDQAHARLLGKVIIQKSAAVFQSIESAFDVTFMGGAATDHGGLLGLTDDDHNTLYPLISGARGFTLDPTIGLLIDGRSTPRDITTGALRQEHTAAIAGTRAHHLDVISAGFDDTRGLVVRQDISGESTAINPQNLTLNADITGATNVHLDFLKVSKVGALGSGMILHAVDIFADINPIRHNSGSAIAIEQAWQYTGSFADVTAAFNSTGTDVQLFVSNGDIVYVGKDTPFTALPVQLAIGADGTGIIPTFEYSQGSAAWASIATSDETNGFRENGTVMFTEPSDWATDTVNSSTKYWIRITRTAVALTTPPTEDLIQYYTPVEYGWDKDGALTIGSISLGGNAVTDTLISSDGASTSDTDIVTAGWIDANVVGGGTLNDAYDFAGAGAGRAIIADSGAVTLTTDGVGVAETTAFELINSTPAGDGAQQFSPMQVFEGQGWKTDATAATQEVLMAIQLETVQGTANPTGELVFKSNINGAGYIDKAKLSTDGQWLMGNGTVTQPPFAFAGIPATGMYLAGSSLAFARSGVKKAILGANVLELGFTGSESAPGLVPSSDPDTGVWWDTNQFVVSTAATEAVRWDASQNQTNAGITSGPDGSVSAPTYGFTSDVDTGLFLHATGQMAFTAGGGDVFRLSNAQVRVRVAGIESQPSLVVGRDDIDTGFWSPSVNNSAFSTGGVERQRWSANTTGLPVSTIPRLAVGEDSDGEDIGLRLQNSTDAGAGAQQFSPMFEFEGQGWRTDTTAETQEVLMAMQLETIQGTASPSGKLAFRSNIDAGGYETYATLGTQGDLTLLIPQPGTVVVADSPSSILHGWGVTDSATTPVSMPVAFRTYTEGVSTNSSTGEGVFHLEFADNFDSTPSFADVLTVDGFGNAHVFGALEIDGALNHDGSTVGLYAATPVVQGDVTGSTAGNAALQDLLTKLAATGIITDSTT